MKNENSSESTPATSNHAVDLLDLQAAALAAAANAVVVTNQTGTVVWVNSAFEQLTGYKHAEIVGQSTRVLNSGQNPPALYKEMWRSILDGKIWRGELINRRKDGSLYAEEMTITPVQSTPGKITHFVAFKQDITERKRLQERTRMLANAVENSPDLVGMSGSDGCIVYVNRALQEALQFSEEELLGKHFHNILSQKNSPALLQEIENNSLKPGGWRGECLVPRKDGTDLPVLLTSSAVTGDDGRILGILGIAQDIAERKHAEERISHLSQALESTSEFIGIGDTNANITFANQAWLRALGYSEQELLGQSFHFILSPNNSAKFIAEIDTQTFAGGWRGECLQRRKDGTDLPVLLSTGLLKDQEGRVAGVFGIARDITERKHAEQEILFKNVLLEAQAETTIDAILAVDEANHIILSNRQFATMWSVPRGMVRAGDDAQLLQFVTNQIAAPQRFLEKVAHLYTHREEKSQDEVHLKDGRVLDRYSSPLIDSAGTYRGRIWYFRDITERVKSEERLQLWSRVLDQSGEGIFVCDKDERILLVNQAFERLTGFSADDAVGKTPRILQSGLQDRAFYADVWKSVLETGTWRGEMWNRRKSGELYVEWLSISAVLDREGSVTHFIGIFSDITVRKQAEERIVHLAHYDALTDLPNRVLLMDRLSQLTKAAQRRKTRVAVVFIDLDRFKEVNDSLGHDAGDLLLQTLAKRLSAAVRDEDTVARIGGDEFVVVFQGLRLAQDVADLAQKLLSCLEAPVSLSGYELAVTASMGISLFPDDATNGQELIRNADAAMYQAKAAGRNAYMFYTGDLNQRALEMLSMENDIRRAIERREFVLYYQPQIDIVSGSVVGAEALIRWNHPDLGLLMPAKFISIAEERGLIVSIGSWVLEEASRQSAAWRNSRGLAIPIAVNVSTVQFRQKDFVEQIANTVRKHGITPNCLELELTERIVMRDAEATVEILQKLHGMGFQLSIDDFGTGYSSLSYLQRFPIDKIKIDQSFVIDKSAESIVAAIVGLARSLKLKVIAEGVQTMQQLETLLALGCDEAQGFFFSPALAPEEFEKLLRK